MTATEVLRRAAEQAQTTNAKCEAALRPLQEELSAWAERVVRALRGYGG